MWAQHLQQKLPRSLNFEMCDRSEGATNTIIFARKIRGEVDMKRVLKALGKTLSQSILLVCTLAFIVLAGLAVVPSQAAYRRSR
jgi:hypothetical protein